MATEEEIVQKEDLSDKYSLFAVKNSKCACPRIEIELLGSKIEVGIDTQASINAISSKTFNSMGIKPDLIEDKSIVFSPAAVTITSPSEMTMRFLPFDPIRMFPFRVSAPEGLIISGDAIVPNVEFGSMALRVGVLPVLLNCVPGSPNKIPLISKEVEAFVLTTTPGRSSKAPLGA